MNYTVYRTTNKLNGMVYIGVHKTLDPNDDYLGSGKILKRAIQKFGIENFQKDVLFIFDTPEEAYSKEKELVNENLILSKMSYNLRLGGDGGFDYIIRNKLQGNRLGSITSEETKDKIRQKLIGRKHAPDTIEKMKILANRPELKDQLRLCGKLNGESLKGKCKTESHKEKISKSGLGIKRISDEIVLTTLIQNEFDFVKTAKALGWKSAGGNNKYRLQRIMGDR